MTDYRADAERVGLFVLARLNSRSDVAHAMAMRNPGAVLENVAHLAGVKRDMDRLKAMVDKARTADDDLPVTRVYAGLDHAKPVDVLTVDRRQMALNELREWARQWSGHPDYQEAVR